jgi:nitronate monooxygenase
MNTGGHNMADWPGADFSIGGVTLKTPIVQGGMGIGISMSGLASAVANQGGVGVLSAAGIGLLAPGGAADTMRANIDMLKTEIAKTRALTKGVLGVNIMVAMTQFADLVKAAVEAKIDVIFSGAGLPLSLPGLVGEGVKTRLVPIVSSARAASTIARWWRDKYRYVPDGFVVEGPMAGGHLGFAPEQLEDSRFQLETLVPQVLQVARGLEQDGGKAVPVIAAGGIFTGADIFRFLQMGASAVQMATRFVATEECDADPAFKEAYIRCRREDIKIIKSPVGMPGRAIDSAFIRQVEEGLKRPVRCPYHCIITCDPAKSPYCICMALLNACRGRMGHGFAFVGANGYRVNEMTTVGALMEELRGEYAAAAEAQRKEKV